MEKFTLQQLEQADEFDIVEYPEFLEGEELKKCYAKYGKYYKQIINEWTEKTQQQATTQTWWERNRPNGSYAFRLWD